MKSIVVGSAHRYNWPDVEYWWQSLKNTGYSGDIVMLSYDNTYYFNQQMFRRGIKIIERNMMVKQVVIQRFLDLAGFCQDLPDDQWVISTDTSDIVFQIDPDQFLSQVKEDIVVAHEGVLFQDNEWTNNNLKSSFPDYYTALRSKFFYNAGSFAAKAGILRKIALSVWELCLDRPGARNHDQAALNIVLQLGPCREMTLFTSPMDTWCFCGASSVFASKDDAHGYSFDLPTIEKGKCYVSGGRLTTMFHHYTRNPNLAREVKRMVDLDTDKLAKNQGSGYKTLKDLNS